MIIYDHMFSSPPVCCFPLPSVVRLDPVAPFLSHAAVVPSRSSTDSRANHAHEQSAHASHFDQTLSVHEAVPTEKEIEYIGII